jgi:transcriptional antiterminator NusG
MDSSSQAISSSDGTEFRWYTLQTLSNYEARAQKAIQNQARNLGLDEWIGRIVFPVENVCEVRNGKKIVRQRKLYPGYLFIELKLYDENDGIRPQLWQFLRNIQGISGFVGSERPAALKQTEVDEILLRLLSKERPMVSKKIYSLGSLVKITDGPFSGSGGEVENLDEEAGTLRVSVTLFGRKTPVDLEFWQVAKEEI